MRSSSISDNHSLTRTPTKICQSTSRIKLVACLASVKVNAGPSLGSMKTASSLAQSSHAPLTSTTLRAQKTLSLFSCISSKRLRRKVPSMILRKRPVVNSTIWRPLCASVLIRTPSCGTPMVALKCRCVSLNSFQ